MDTTAHKKESRDAFLNGFMRGLGGAVCLYSNNVSAPAPAKASVPPIRNPVKDSVQEMRSDWVTVGLDIDCAITKYGQTT